MFTEKKFCSLSHRRQHKKAGEYLRTLYEKQFPIDRQYRKMEAWLNLPPIETPEAMADRFHLHMKEASIALQEHNLLIKRFDTLSDTPYRPIHIYLDDLRSAFNIGNILRTTEAFRLGTIIFSENTPDHTHPKVQKTAMGASPPCKQGTLTLCPRPFIALETVEGATPLRSFSFPESFTLLLGNEERGVKQSTLQEADFIVEIPLVGSKNSLNVASAFAIVAATIDTNNPISL
ncbi:MAG: TrmH family RNA methyltransferase [Chlamydiia bacterium]|nr:TrmH family RNA methyltransferase [Chlamydiia bacterium]